jgi:hypothetical protein
MWQTRGRSGGGDPAGLADTASPRDGAVGSPGRRTPLSPMSKSSPSKKRTSAAAQSRRFGERIAAGKYASSSEDDENDDDGVNAIAAVAKARELIALSEKPKPKKKAAVGGAGSSGNSFGSSGGPVDRASMLVLRLTVVASTKSERSPEHPSWCDAVLEHLVAQSGDFDATSQLNFVRATYQRAPAGAANRDAEGEIGDRDGGAGQSGIRDGMSDTLRAAERRRAQALGESGQGGRGTRSVLGKSKYSNLEAEMLSSTGQSTQYLEGGPTESRLVGGPNSNKTYPRLVTIAVRASPDAAKQIWRAVRNRRVKLGGVGNVIGGRVQRVVLLEVEGMTALTGDGDDAPRAMLGAIKEGGGSNSMVGERQQVQREEEQDGRRQREASNDRDSGGSGSDDDSGDYRARRGKGGLGRSGGVPARWERLGMSLRRTRMSTLLDRLGDRVVDLREAYESVTAEKAGEGRGSTGQFSSRVCCDDLMKLFWTVGVDDAGEIVRDYETLLRKEFGEDTSAFLSFDDFLRVYDYHEQSILGPGGGGGGGGTGASARLGSSSRLRPAPRQTRLAGAQMGGTTAAGSNVNVGSGGAMQAMATQADMARQQWVMSGGDGASVTSSRNSAQGQALRAAFDKYDVDKDGLISFLDLRTRFRQMGRTNVPDLEIRRWIADKDRRGAGNVSFEEFERAYGHIKAGANAGRGGGVRLGGTGASTLAGGTMSTTGAGAGGRDGRGADGRGDVAGSRFDSVDASDVKRMRESITAGRRAARELEDMEQKELLRLFNGNQELMVRGRAFFDRFDAYNRGVVPAERLKNLLEQMGFK